MSNVNLTKEQAIESVKNSPASIFSKEDVIKLIKNIIPGAGGNAPSGYSASKVKDLLYEVRQAREMLETEIRILVENIVLEDLIDKDSVEFRITDNNRIEILDVDMDTSGLLMNIESEFEDFDVEIREIEEEFNS